MCEQCIDSGIRYGSRRRTNDVLAWAKKKKRFIKREDLIAFLSDKPEPTLPQPNPADISSARMEDEHFMSVPSPVGSCCFSNSVGSPRRRLMCREDVPPEGDIFSQRDSSRKRQNNFNFEMGGINSTSSTSEFGPLMKRIKF